MDDMKAKKIFKSKIEVKPSGCWEWMGSKHRKGGYGLFSFGGVTMYAHKYSWKRTNGRVPEGLKIRHTCGSNSCVNPDHMELLTHEEIQRRAAQGGVWDGTRNGNSRRAPAEVLAIKIISEVSPDSAKYLSEALGIPLRSVYLIRSRKIWAHLEPPPFEIHEGGIRLLEE